MSYATQQDLVDRFGGREISGLSGGTDGSTIIATPVARALADADSEIDAYLAARYALPLSPVPAVVLRLAADIARYRLWDVKASEQVKARYEDAVRLLKLMASGDTVLPNAAAIPAAAGSVTVSATTRTRRFTSGMFDAFDRSSGGGQSWT
jgi:phage gp36-like protein